MTRTLLALSTLTGVYLLALASVAPGDIACGVAVATGALVVARRAPGNPTGSLRSVPALLPFFASVLVNVARGTWEVALVVLGVRRPRASGTVEVPIGERSELGTIVSALASTLSPGEVLLDIDAERGVYIIHALDADDPDKLRARHRRDYERRQRKALP